MPKLVLPPRRLAHGLLASTALISALGQPVSARAQSLSTGDGEPIAIEQPSRADDAVASVKPAVGAVTRTVRVGGRPGVLSAATAWTAARNAVTVSGRINARSIADRSGSIVIGGGEGGRATTMSGLSDTPASGAPGALVRPRATSPATPGGRRSAGAVPATGRMPAALRAVALARAESAGGTVSVTGAPLLDAGDIDMSGALAGHRALTGRTLTDQGGVDLHGMGGTGGPFTATLTESYVTGPDATLTASGVQAGGGIAVGAPDMAETRRPEASRRRGGDLAWIVGEARGLGVPPQAAVVTSPARAIPAGAADRREVHPVVLSSDDRIEAGRAGGPVETASRLDFAAAAFAEPRSAAVRPGEDSSGATPSPFGAISGRETLIKETRAAATPPPTAASADRGPTIDAGTLQSGGAGSTASPTAALRTPLPVTADPARTMDWPVDTRDGPAVTTETLYNSESVIAVTLASRGAPVPAEAGSAIAAGAATDSGLSDDPMAAAMATVPAGPAPLTITGRSAGQAGPQGSTAFTTGTLSDNESVSGATLASRGAPVAVQTGSYTINGATAAVLGGLGSGGAPGSGHFTALNTGSYGPEGRRSVDAIDHPVDDRQACSTISSMNGRSGCSIY